MAKISFKSEKEFTLNSVKFKSKGGLLIEYQMQTGNGSIVDCSLDTNEEAHPDLMDLIDQMKEPIIFCANGLAGVNVLLGKKMILDQKIKDSAIKELKKDLLSAMFDDVRIHGVHFYHINDGMKVKITGGFDSPLGYAAINTPQIGFQEIKHGFEEALEKTLETLQNEVYKYIADNKRAQLDMFDEDNQEAA